MSVLKIFPINHAWYEPAGNSTLQLRSSGMTRSSRATASCFKSKYNVGLILLRSYRSIILSFFSFSREELIQKAIDSPRFDQLYAKHVVDQIFQPRFLNDFLFDYIRVRSVSFPNDVFVVRDMMSFIVDDTAGKKLGCKPRRREGA
jgi:hypothetical protein